MSSPDLEPLDADLAALLDAERRRPGPAPAVQGRVLARVIATVSPGGGGPPRDPGGGAAAAAGAGGAAAGLLKPILLGLALGSVVAAGIVMAPDPQPAAPALHAGAPEGTAPPRRLDEHDDAGAPDPPAPAPRAPVAASASAGHEESLAAERLLLDEAQRAVAEGRSAAAFAALDRHPVEFPRGRMAEERDALWIRALAGAGRLDEARARAARFRRSYPRSMLLPALESMLGTIP